jgi:hypothetical protein
VGKDAKEEPGLLKSLDQFWFGHGSPTALAVFRIFMGTLVFLNLLMIAVDWDAWFSERGFVPAWLGQLWMSPGVLVWRDPEVVLTRINVLNGVVDPRLAMGIYAVITLSAFTTAIGLWTRVSTIVLAIGVVSLHHRNGIILHGGDTLMRVMVLYLAVAPVGRACSVDRLVRLWKGKEGPEPVRVSLWAQRLIMYNMALIYFTTVWLKWGGTLWRDGTATYYPARLAEFYRFPVPRFLNDVPMVYVTTYGTLLVEFALATLVFYRPFRKWVLLSGLMLHGYIEYSMNIPLFSWLMVSMYICFYDGEEVSAWFQRQGQRLKRFAMIVRLPKGTRLSPTGVAFFDAADPLKLVTYLPGDGAAITKADARRSWMRSMGAWIFGWIPGLWMRLLSRKVEPLGGSTS